jgi:hypothetical protein
VAWFCTLLVDNMERKLEGCVLIIYRYTGGVSLLDMARKYVGI